MLLAPLLDRSLNRLVAELQDTSVELSTELSKTDCWVSTVFNIYCKGLWGMVSAVGLTATMDDILGMLVEAKPMTAEEKRPEVFKQRDETVHLVRNLAGGYARVLELVLNGRYFTVEVGYINTCFLLTRSFLVVWKKLWKRTRCEGGDKLLK